MFKGTLTRYLHQFFHEQFPQAPSSIPGNKATLTDTKIRADIRNWMIITGVNDTGDHWISRDSVIVSVVQTTFSTEKQGG
jgi:hypothetical protein